MNNKNNILKEIKIDKEVDFTGLKCPLPVLKARRVLKDLKTGQKVKILADDPAATLDFHHFCEISGNIMIDEMSNKSVLTFIIEKV